MKTLLELHPERNDWNIDYSTPCFIHASPCYFIFYTFFIFTRIIKIHVLCQFFFVCYYNAPLRDISQICLFFTRLQKFKTRDGAKMNRCEISIKNKFRHESAGLCFTHIKKKNKIEWVLTSLFLSIYITLVSK